MRAKTTQGCLSNSSLEGGWIGRRVRKGELQTERLSQSDFRQSFEVSKLTHTAEVNRFSLAFQDAC